MTVATATTVTTATQEALALLVTRYNTLGESSLPALLAGYAENAHFKDPFNDVTGRGEIERIFRHMYATLERPVFSIQQSLAGERDAMLRWDFRFGLNGRAFVVPGSTALRFDERGVVIDHVDFWDPTETLWSHLPVVGVPVRWLRRRFSSAEFNHD
ncbi:MAG: nuclear transport factor 2 family protein [Burkholderiales bacterium]|nr:nuclear transport factor 2 family protein [Burkholderiales bacterium]